MNFLADSVAFAPARASLFDDYSIEITAKDATALDEVAALLPAGTQVAITFLPGEDPAARVAAAVTVRRLGFEPMPHFSARRLPSQAAFDQYLAALVGEAGVTRCFIVAGDTATPAGPFAESMDLIATGAFERAGVTMLGIAGHPESHAHMDRAASHAVLAGKSAAIRRRGMHPLVVTQFGFDAAPVLAWLDEIRAAGVDAPVRLGVPGPAGIKTLLRFAARCGVGASASVLTKYGISLSRLFGSAGPEPLIDALADGLRPAHGPVALHFYPFGGLERTAQWIAVNRDRA